MRVHFFNWSAFKEISLNISLSKKKLQESIIKHFDVYNISEVSIIFIKSKDIKKLNKQYRGANSVTDVLSFVIDRTPLLAEVYVCLEYIKENTPANLYCEEVLRNIVHGLLHIAGYDHKGNFSNEKGDIEKMFVKQEDILHNIVNEIDNGTGQSR